MGIFRFQVLLTAVWCLSSVLALIIDQDTVVDFPVSLEIGSLQVNEGVSYTIKNNLLTVLAGNLDNRGSWFVTSTNGLAASVTIASGTILNSGDLVFDTLQASVISNYNLDSIGTFSNTGNMWIGISTFSLVPPIILGSALDWTNSGRIYLKQETGAQSPITVSQVLGFITNDGAICLERVNWVQTTSIVGDGCVNVMDDGHLQLEITPWFVSDEQTIYLSSPSSALSVLGLEPSLLGAKTYNVLGFGGGNEIRVNTGFTDYLYNDGVLSLSFFLGIFSIDFNIGEGYSASGFSTNGIGRGGTSISYSEEYPGEVPDQCLCDDFLQPPEDDVSISLEPPEPTSEPESSTDDASEPNTTDPEPTSDPTDPTDPDSSDPEPTSEPETSEPETSESETALDADDSSSTDGSSGTDGPSETDPDSSSTDDSSTDESSETDGSSDSDSITDSTDATDKPTKTDDGKTTTVTECTETDGKIVTKTVVICETTESNGHPTTITTLPPRTTTYVTHQKTITEVVCEKVVEGTITIYTTVTKEALVTQKPGDHQPGDHQPAPSTVAGEAVTDTTQTVQKTAYVSTYEGGAPLARFGLQWLLSLVLLVVL